MGGCLASCFASCAGSCLGSCMAKCFGMGTVTAGVTKKLFAGLQLWYFMFLLLMRGLSMDLLNSWHWIEFGIWQCRKSSSTEAVEICYEDNASARVTFCGLIIFVVCLLAAFFGQGGVALTSFWVFKFVGVVLLYALSLFVPNGFFIWLPWFAVIMGAVFLVLQMMLLLDLGYAWNELWLENAREDQRADIDLQAGQKWYVALIVFGVGFCLASVGGCIGMQTTYGVGSVGMSVLIWAVFLCATIMTVISITEWCKHGAFLPSAILSAYFTYLTWIACVSNPINGHYGGLNIGLCMVGLVVMLIALVVFVRNPNLLQLGSAPEDTGLNEALTNGSNILPNEDPENATEKQVNLLETVFFFGVQIGALLYLNMLVSQHTGYFEFWVMVVCVWVNVGLYAYSLIAPTFDRERVYY